MNVRHPFLSRPLLLAASLLLSVLGLCAVAGAEAAAKPKVTILTPKDGAKPASGKVKVKVRVKGNDFRAFLNGNIVTRRFRKAGGNIRQATFRRGKDFRIGQTDLLVAAGAGQRTATDHHFITTSKRVDRLLRVKPSKGLPLVVPGFRIRARNQLLSSRVWLNGRNVKKAFDDHMDLRGIVGELDAGTPVRHGLNRVRVKVRQRDGRFAIRNFRFRIPLKRPIASAGNDRTATAGDTLRLNSTKSRKPREGKRKNRPLRHSWKLVSKPDDSDAVLGNTNGPHPTLKTDIPGAYRAQVTVTSGNGKRSVDHVDLGLTLTDSAMGMPVQTITDAGAIQIGDTSIPSNTYPRTGNWVQMIVIDPGYGTPLAGSGWDGIPGVKHPQDGVIGFDTGQGQKLLQAVDATKETQMVILSGQGQSVNLDSSDAKNLNAAINNLGGMVATTGGTPQGIKNLANGQWSLIGHRGLSNGAAYQNYLAHRSPIEGFMNGDPGAPGSLNGYFQNGISSVGYQFVSPDVVPIDTKWTPNITTPPSPAQNTIEIGETKYVSTNIATSSEATGCPCSVGIQLLVLDPANLEPVEQGTFGILNMGGGTNNPGISALNQTLSKYVNRMGVGQSYVVVLQDFGHWLSADWPANSADWIQDNLPDNSYTPRWKGNSWPTKTSDLLEMWNGGKQFGTVAGNIGRLAGPEAHDIVANYRRPVYSPATNTVIPRTWGGLSVIATTNLFQWSSAYAVGQGENPPWAGHPAAANNPLLDNGRLTGTLQRNEQSQWEMSGATKGAGYPGLGDSSDPDSEANLYGSGSLAALMNQPQSAWPCSFEYPAPCEATPTQVRSAMRYITGQLREIGTMDDIRELYTNSLITWSEHYSDITNDKIIKCAGHAGFSSQTCESLRGFLAGEFEDLDEVNRSFPVLADLISKQSLNSTMDLNKLSGNVTTQVQKAYRNLMKEETEADWVAPLADALYVTSEVVEFALAASSAPETAGTAPAAIGALASLIDLGADVYPFFSPDQTSTREKNKIVNNETSAIRDRTSNLTNDIKNQLIGIQQTVGHYQMIAVTDPVKLSQAADNFTVNWKINDLGTKRLGQSIVVGTGQSLYDSIMPIAFNQWVLSPRATELNPLGARDLPERGYNCFYQDGDGHIDGNDLPLSNEPASMSGMSSVTWAANYGPNAQPITVRALKLNVDNMKVVEAEFEEDDGDNYLRHKGGTTPASILDPLFAPPTVQPLIQVPTAFNMDKDEFFGQPGWAMRKLQCGRVQN